ncbi:MAG: peptidoglycan editing factor PgeF [Alphaproteobacteria bacterium]
MAQDIEYLTAKNLEDTKTDIFHGFFTRKGGKSSASYKALNCGFDVGDQPENVIMNRSRVANSAGVNPEDLLSLHQVHGADVITARASWTNEQRPSADALVTDIPGIALGILTADCAPVLFVGFKNDGSPVIGAAHAGWRGAMNGVMESTLREILDKGARKETLRAAIGPCISRESYEVKETFAEPFLQEDPHAEQFFHAGQKNARLNFDLPSYCAWRLARFGLKNVSLLDVDTYTNADMFYSYRRTSHKKEKECGRQISVISTRTAPVIEPLER